MSGPRRNNVCVPVQRFWRLKILKAQNLCDTSGHPEVAGPEDSGSLWSLPAGEQTRRFLSPHAQPVSPPRQSLTWSPDRFHSTPFSFPEVVKEKQGAVTLPYWLGHISLSPRPWPLFSLWEEKILCDLHTLCRRVAGLPILRTFLNPLFPGPKWL